jgi:hypothetical protein
MWFLMKSSCFLKQEEGTTFDAFVYDPIKGKDEGYVQQGVENNVGHLLCALYGLKLSLQI